MIGRGRDESARDSEIFIIDRKNALLARIRRLRVSDVNTGIGGGIS